MQQRRSNPDMPASPPALHDGRPDPEPAAPTDDTRHPGILAQLWQQRLVVVGVAGVTFMLIMGLLFVLPVSYVATGSVIVSDREPLLRPNSASATQKIGDPADMESTILLVRSPRVLRLMLAEPGFAEAIVSDCQAAGSQVLSRLRPPHCDRLPGEPDAQFGWVEDRFSVAAVGRSRVLTVSYRSVRPDLAAGMVNGLIRTFLQDEQNKMLRTREQAIEWLQERLHTVEAELQRDEAAIEDYRARNGLVRGVAASLPSERLTQAAQQLADARTAEAEATLRVQEAGGGGASRQALEMHSTTDIKQQLATARAQAASLAQRLGANNPALLQARQLEASLARQLGSETGRIGEAAGRTLAAARARVAAAQKELDRRTGAASEAAAAETAIAAMVRDLNSKRASSADLAQRVNQLELERRALEPPVQLVSMAEVPARPAFPQRMPFLVGGLTLAGVMGVAAGLLTYRPSTAGPLSIGRTFTRTPILAQIPELRLRSTSRRALVGRAQGFPLAAALSLIDSHPPLQESLRILHARLTLAGFGTTRRTLMITSEVAGEGKSFVTMALARMALASGRRVLVIESCLRQPMLEEALNGPPSPGLGGFLLGGPADIVKLSSMPGVDVLLAGEPLPTSTELLSGPRFAELLGAMDSYDLVLIDSAPVSDLMDSALIAPHVDGVLFCLRAGRPPAEGGLSSLPTLHRDNNNVVGLAVTFVTDERVGKTAIAKPATLRLRQPAMAGHA